MPSAANAVVTVPTNLSPNDTTSAPGSDIPSPNHRTNLLLSWSAVPGATSYVVEITNGQGKYEPEPSVREVTSLTTFPVPPGLPEGDYAWRVSASGGAFSDDAYFTRGWDVAPGNPHQVSTAGPVVAWDAVRNASYYEVQFSLVPFPPSPYDLALSENGDDTGFVSCNTTATVLSPNLTIRKSYPTDLRDGAIDCTELAILSDDSPAQSETGSWFWRVRARDGVLDTANNKIKGVQPAQSCTGIWLLKTVIDTPSTPACSAWAYPTDGPAEQYQKVAVRGIGGVFDDIDIPTGLEIGPRVGSGRNPVTVSNSPVFSWDDAGEDASFYRVILSRDSKMKSHDFVWETQATSLSPLAQLPDHPNRWYWTVQACAVEEPDPSGFILSADAAFCTDGATDPDAPDPVDNPQAHSFAQIAPTLVQPISEAPVTGGRTFVWSTLQNGSKPGGTKQVAAPDPAGYQFQASDSRGSFTTPSFTRVTDAYGTVAGQSRLTLPTNVLPNGYRWRVRAIDETNNLYPWSNSRLVGQLQSASGRLTTGSGFTLTSPVNFTFNAPVTNVNASTVKVVATSSNRAQPGSITSVGGTNYRFTPSARWVAGESYRLQVSGVTTGGTNAPAIASGASIRAVTSVDSANPALTKKRGDYGWATGSASDARGKSYVRSNDKAKTKARSTVSTRVRGSKLYVYGCWGKSSGKARIYVDGRTRATVDLYRSYSKCGKIATISLTSGSQHTVSFAPIGSKRKKATSTQVRFDGFAVA